mgnify:CR=1 FL=1|tara:strand:+ start:106 stop:978 length:873 start_codon:yes stop_codon:yes gene_type:complete
MDETNLSNGNQKSQERNNYNRSVAAYNRQISKKINQLQKTPKADTTQNDLTSSFRDGLVLQTGKATVKNLNKTLKMKSNFSELNPEEVHIINVPNSTHGDIVKFNSREEGPSVYKMPSETPTGTVENPIQAEPVTVKAESVLADVDEPVEKMAGKGVGLAELGEVAGVAEGADAISKDVEGKWKTFNTAQKIGNVADIASGVLDAASVVVPFLAPVAGVAGAVAGLIGGVADEIGDDKAAAVKKQGQVNKGITNLQSQKKQYMSSPAYAQIGLMASPQHDTSRITGSYSF